MKKDNKTKGSRKKPLKKEDKKKLKRKEEKKEKNLVFNFNQNL